LRQYQGAVAVVAKERLVILAFLVANAAAARFAAGESRTAERVVGVYNLHSKKLVKAH